ncbi:MAG: glutathione S-transferase family protein [Myxococcales bacterium]|nr:glutathione S-transferase family protein [Myxococcales bacterium]MCB9749286.1 glutathione S-transferase family protein [Myxococcales bacterium]
MQHTVALYHYLTSIGSMQARLALAEKRVRWRSELVNTIRAEHLAPAYVRINPHGTIPTLVHNGLVIVDALTILRYIDDELPGPALTSDDPDERACMEKWLEVQDIFPLQELCFGTLEGLNARVAHQIIDERIEIASRMAERYPDLRARYHAKLDDMEAFAEIYRDPRRVTTLVRDLAVTLQLMEHELEGRRWLAGYTYSLADVAWAAIFSRLESCGFAHFWDRHPRVRELIARQRMRASFDAAITVYWNNEIQEALTRAGYKRKRLADALVTVSAME